MRPCVRRYDADFVARALSGDLSAREAASFFEHAGACPACRRTASLRAAARDAWERARQRDDSTARAQREERLLSVGHVQRTRRRAALQAALLVALLSACVFFFVERRARRGPAPPSPAAALLATSPSPATTAPASSIAGEPEGSRATVAKTEVAGAGMSVMASRGTARASRGPLPVGSAIPQGDLVTVQSGAALLLSWTLSDEGESPGSKVELSGPAQMKMSEERGTSVLVLDAGTARVSSSWPRVVRTAYAVVSAQRGEWSVTARARATYVDARAAKVVVDEISGPETTLEPGQTLWVDSEGAHLAVRAPGSAPTKAEVPDRIAADWRASEQAIARGDASSAEASLAAVVAGARDPSLRERAQLRLGELLLARGALDDGRARLAPLLSSADPSLAAAAAFLYASSFRDPVARDGAWRIYLSLRPPSPHYEDALLEDAFAKVEGGDRDGARSIVDELRARSLSPVTADGLKKLERRLSR